MAEAQWHRIDPGDLAEGRVTTVIVAHRALAITRTPDGWGCLDNRCPHQGGPLGEGQIEDGCLICPWHGFEYDPVSGTPPGGYDDVATSYPIEERPDGVYVKLPPVEHRVTLMDQMVEVMNDWGIDTVFGMVGHSNLGLAEAFRKAEAAGRLRYFGIRHEGAAAFAASGFAKTARRPAACFSIAGPGATNLLTGLWDAKVDRVPVLALTGQVQTQVLGPGAFQEVPLAEAFQAVAEWSQTVLTPANGTELMALAIKHAVVKRDVAHLIFPDEVQELEGTDPIVEQPRSGRIAAMSIGPPHAEFERAIALLAAAERPAIIVGNGGRPHRAQIIELAEKLDAPLITTFKAKGTIPDSHPLACGVLGRSGTPIASSMMGHSDCLLVLGASFSNHTGISKKKTTIQVDLDRMALGKFHPVDVPLWGEIERTVAMMCERFESHDRGTASKVAGRWKRWRAEKQKRASWTDNIGRMHPARLFDVLSKVAPNDAVIPVDVGNNTYAFGHYFECGAHQDIIMSGYLGSIGFSFPAAMGAWAAVGDRRKVISISGDGGFGQYLAEFTTAVKYGMGITHVLLNNDELAKISREQVSAIRPVWQTDLVNPDFADFARSCGGIGFTVSDPADLEPVLMEAIAVTDRPTLVEVATAGRWV